MAKSKKGAPLPARRHCTFWKGEGDKTCGRYVSSDTHIWPAWLSKELPKKSGWTLNHAVAHSIPIRNVPRSVIRKVRPQDMFSTRPRLTCSKCNSGWMSTVDNKPRVFLPPLLTGGAEWALSEEQKRSLAGFLALVVTLAEYGLTQAYKTVTADNRQHLRATGLPPPSWSIFVGSLTGPYWLKKIAYHSFTTPSKFDSEGKPLLDQNGKAIRNAHVATMGIGTLLSYSAYIPEKDQMERFTRSAEAYNLKRIWPLDTISNQIPPKELQSGSLPILSDVQADNLADHLAKDMQGRRDLDFPAQLFHRNAPP